MARLKDICAWTFFAYALFILYTMFWQTYDLIAGYWWLWHIYKVLFAPIFLFDFNIWIPWINMPLKAFVTLLFALALLVCWWKLKARPNS